MHEPITIYDADPALRLTRVADSLKGGTERLRRAQRIRRASSGAARMLAAFGGEHFLSQAHEFLNTRGPASSDLLIVYLDQVSQADAALVLLHLHTTPGSHVRAMLAPGVDALRRLVRGHHIGIPGQILVDARLEGRTLFLTDAELHRHSVRCDEVRQLRSLSDQELAAFRLDENGRFLAWPSTDLEMTLHGLRQAGDEAYRTHTAIAELKRSARYGAAIRDLREAAGIRQADVPGLSERQLRRLETGESQPTIDAMQALAARHGLALGVYLDRVAAACGSSTQA